MNKRDVAFLTCRVLAMLLFAFAIIRLEPILSGLYWLWGPARALYMKGVMISLVSFCVAVLPNVIAVLMGRWLWRRADHLSDRLTLSDSPDGSAAPMDRVDWLWIVVIGVAVYAIFFCTGDYLQRRVAVRHT